MAVTLMTLSQSVTHSYSMRVILAPTPTPITPLTSTFINPFSADHDFCRFHPVLSVDHITDIGNEICLKHQVNVNVWSQIKQISVIFNYLIHSLKWLKI